MILTKTYDELITLKSFEERFDYLRCSSTIGEDIFGYNRYLNQIFYRSPEWRNFRNKIIVRDNGCNMALREYPIYGLIVIHHINPITMEDIVNRNFEVLLNPENVICVSDETHKLIHYGDISVIDQMAIGDRSPNDMNPWKI